MPGANSSDLKVSSTLIKLGSFSLKIPNLEIASSCIHVTGPNGSGKSTFLKLLAGLIEGQEPSTGTNEKGITIGYVPQNYRATLLPWLSAEQNVKLLNESEDQVSMLLGLNFSRSDLNKKPFQLSGGQCQRIAIVRDCRPKVDLLLMDEPFASLDVNTIPVLGSLLFRQIQNGTRVVLTSHIDLPKTLSGNASVQELTIERSTEYEAVLGCKP